MSFVSKKITAESQKTHKITNNDPDSIMASITMTSIYNKFPFKECTFSNLKETPKHISIGLRSSLRDTYKPISLALQQYLERTETEQGLSQGLFQMGFLEEEYLTEELAIDELFELVAKKVLQSPLKSNLKQIQDSKIDREQQNIDKAREQVGGVLDSEYTSILEDVSFLDIKNYVINSVMQKSKNIKKLSEGKLAEDALMDEIDELVNDKYIDLKQDAFFDNCTVFFVYPYKIASLGCDEGDTQDQGVQDEEVFKYDVTLDIESCYRHIIPSLTHPTIYDSYKDIWQLQHNEYKYYDREFYYSEYFDILKFFSTKNQEQRTADEYLKRALTMNVEKFMVYYSKELNEEETDDEFEEQESFIFALDGTDLTESISIWSEDSGDEFEEEEEEINIKMDGLIIGGKSLRFNDHVDVIGINTEEPAFFVYCDRNSIEI